MGISEIGDSMLAECYSLKTIRIPDSVTKIGDFAFSYCRSLVSVTMPSGLISIGGFAFSNCDSLNTVYIPEGVTTISTAMFFSCGYLSSVQIPQSVTTIDKSAFEYCNKLTVYGTPGSYSETFAKENNYTFSPIVRAATPTESTVIVSGEIVRLEAYNFDGSNYFKLRDLAMMLNGTDKQFELDYNSGLIILSPGKPYTPLGGEFKSSGSDSSRTAVFKIVPISLGGNTYNMNAYEIEGCNYVKLRGLGDIVGFYVTYDHTSDSMAINT
jgi:hypothetical protein